MMMMMIIHSFNKLYTTLDQHDGAPDFRDHNNVEEAKP